jgi:hypothetical protein
VSVSIPSPAILSDASRGLAQQMVWWGHDVRHPGGNALVSFGLRRSKSPGLPGTSCYSMEWEEGLIELHGAVASWAPPVGKTGCVFCRDLGRIGLWRASLPPVPGEQTGECGTAEERWESFKPFLRWLIEYEQWVVAALGSDWRSGCWRAVKRLPNGKQWLPPHLALKWWKLAGTSHPPRPKNLLKR